jgi:hypothetical protein
MIRTLLLAGIVMGSGVANQVGAATVSWLGNVRAIASNEPPTAALRPAWCVADWPEWQAMEPTVHNAFNFAALDAMLALQRQNGMSNIILHIKSAPADVDYVGWAVPSPSNYVTRISHLVAHLAAHAPTAKTGLWIMPDNEPAITDAGFARHAAILKACWNASGGRLKIVGCVLQGSVPPWFAELAALGCGQWCDVISFHYYDNFQRAPDVKIANRGPLYDDILAIAKSFPGKPIFCDEFGLCPDIERNRIAVLSMLAAGVQFIQPFQWGADMNLHYPDESATRLHGDYPWGFYRCWNLASNCPAPYAQCILDLAAQIGSNPKATLLRTPSGLHVIKFSNGAQPTPGTRMDSGWWNMA